jgi:hypothetical protein
MHAPGCTYSFYNKSDTLLKISVADPHHFDGNPDPTILFDADPKPTFPFGADPDPDPAPHQSDANLRQLTYRPSTDPFLTLQASIVRVHSPSWLQFDPL